MALYTDLPPEDRVDALPSVFDQAVVLWADYFEVPRDQTDSWRLNAFLMQDQEPFAALGMLPGKREILTGFATQDNVWINEQPVPYYRRHLWLHEGTHAFMHAFLGRTAPGWFMEGLAELLATHRLDEGELEIGIMPRGSAEVPALGRIELVRQDVDQGRVYALEHLMQIDNRRPLSSEVYAWCWAMAKFLDSHPRYRDRFRQLARSGRDLGFEDRFREAFAADWHDMETEWVVYATTLSYNHDLDRTMLDLRIGDRHPEPGRLASSPIRADAGWQNSGIFLDAGKTYRISASGRFQVDDEPEPWWCTPTGVTIHYNRGRPLGILLAALLVRTEAEEPRAASFLNAVAIGGEKSFTPAQSGTLYLRINDSPGNLHDNQGQLMVDVLQE